MLMNRIPSALTCISRLNCGDSSASLRLEQHEPNGLSGSAMLQSRASRRLGRELLALLDRLLDAAHHVEGGLRKMIVFAFDQTLEALDGVLQVDQLAGRAREHLGDVERLRQ